MGDERGPENVYPILCDILYFRAERVPENVCLILCGILDWETREYLRAWASYGVVL